MYKCKYIFFLVLILLLTILSAVTVFSANTVSITGYVKPEFDFSDSSLMAGFKVEAVGTQWSALTDNSGCFSIADIPYGQSLNLVITKTNYLTRQIGNITASGNIMLGSHSQPLYMWAGDISINGTQDGAINISDVMQMVGAFNTAASDSRYNETMDFNKDNAINLSDIMILVKYFNRGIQSYPQASISISTPPPTNPPSYTATNTKIPSPTATPVPSASQNPNSSDRYFPAGTSKSELITKASALSVSQTKAIIKQQVDQHWDVLVNVCGFKSKESASAFFFGFATRESTFRAATETGGGSAHSFGPLQTAETAYANANPNYMPETNVPEMFQYDFKDENFYDVGISVHMGLRHFLHFAKLAKEKYSGKDILRYGMMGFNTGWVDGSDAGWIAQYADEAAALAGWYLNNNHMSDDQFTWDTDPRVDRSNPWSWY